LLNADGSPFSDVFEVKSGIHSVNWKSMAYDDVGQRYLVVWAEDDGGRSAIMGQLRDRNGVIVTGSGDPDINISGAYPGDGPAVTFDSRSGLFMVVWFNSIEETEPGYAGAILGRMVASSGSMSGEVFLVTSGTDYHGQPTVANDRINHRFLVAWVQMPWSYISDAQGVRQRRSGETADLPDDHIAVAGQLLSNLGEPIGGVQEISTAPQDHLFPQLAFDPVHSRYLAVFQAVDLIASPAAFCRGSAAIDLISVPLMGQFLGLDGAAIDTSPSVNFHVGSDAAIFTPPAMANDSICGRFLAAWLKYYENRPALAVIGGPCATLPKVETSPVSAVTTTGATGGGMVMSDGGAEVTKRGVCWNTSGGPTLRNSHSSDGSGLGSFTSRLSGLIPDVAYHVRAYAGNLTGTAYGNEVTFTTARWVVTFLADAGGALSGQTPQYVGNGGGCTPVQAIAQAGYFFRRWDGSDASSSLADSLTVINVGSDLAFTARFGSLDISAKRLIEHAWIIRAEYAKIEVAVGGLADSAVARFRLMSKADGGEWEQIKEILPGDFQNGHYVFATPPLEKGRSYTFRIEANSASGVLLGASVEVMI
jgi:hypothetical protein